MDGRRNINLATVLTTASLNVAPVRMQIKAAWPGSYGAKLQKRTFQRTKVF
jgi:hypothetical protein